MLLQKSQIGKTAVIVIILILLATLIAVPVLLRADSSGEATQEADLFLPVVYNQADGTPDPGTNATPTPTSSQTPSPTHTPTSTSTPTPRGDIEFEGSAVADNNFVLVSGDVGIEVTIINLTTGITLGNGILGGPFDGHACPGFGSISLSPALTTSDIGNVLLAMQTDVADNVDTTIVVGVAPTSTPTDPYIFAIPDCGPEPDFTFYFQGYNWPIDQSVTLFWEGTAQMVLQANQHTGFFSFNWTFQGLSDGIYTISALSGTNGIIASDQVYIPCGILPTNTPTPTSTPIPDTPVPVPADLVVGQPVLVSTPPIIVYEPIAFEVPITNTGDIAIETLFFVDLLFDPQSGHPTDVYTAVSGLSGNSTVTLTITSTIGLANFLGTHQVTGWVDSLDHIGEADETNNLSEPWEIIISSPAGTPTSTPIPAGTETISGTVQIVTSEILPVERAVVTIIDEESGLVIASTYSDGDGFYSVENIPSGPTYTVQACITIDNNEYFGVRTGISPSVSLTNIFILPGSCP